MLDCGGICGGGGGEGFDAGGGEAEKEVGDAAAFDRVGGLGQGFGERFEGNEVGVFLGAGEDGVEGLVVLVERGLDLWLIYELQGVQS